MKLRCSVFVLLTLFATPAIGNAGPIKFDLYPTNLSVEPGHPALSAALSLALSPNPWAIVDSEHPVVVPMAVVDYKPWNLPQPRSIDVYPDGTTHWNNDGYFRVDLQLTDSASGESADFSVWGRAHMYNQFANGQWSGTTWFWFMGFNQFTLGVNEYTIWETNWYDQGPPTVDVWIGPNAPFSAT